MITTRDAEPADIPTLYDILNEIVEIGGTTSFLPPFTQTDFKKYFFTERCLSLVVAQNTSGKILGWQALDLHKKLPKDVGDVGSYVKIGHVGKGVGTAVFKHTKKNAMALGLTQINATIRADNQSGLSYYTKMDFVDHSTDPSFALPSGEIVGKISKRYQLC